MTATFAADVTLRTAQDRLSELGQWLPIDGDPDAPLGTLVDHNSTGPLRLGYGAWRDLLLGVQFTNGRGELITAGGRPGKNGGGDGPTQVIGGRGGGFRGGGASSKRAHPRAGPGGGGRVPARARAGGPAVA